MTTQLKVNITKVDAEKVRALRYSELRKGQDFSTTSYIEDYEAGTFHMACIVDEKIVTCASYYPEKSMKIKSDNAYRFYPMRVNKNNRTGFHGINENISIENYKEIVQFTYQFIINQN